MIIALTGTPGTGKTTVCGIIGRHSQYRKQFKIIDLNKLVLDETLYSGKDEARDTYIADMERLEKRVEQEISRMPECIDVILEGHLAHLLPADAVIVLRAHPLAIRRRLGEKEYSSNKIKENADAEALDVILVESVEICRNVFEIDTTDMNPLAVVRSVVSIVEDLKQGRIPEAYLPGKMDWIEQVSL